MKKRLLVLGMAIICIFGMTACGKAADESAANALGITEEGARYRGIQVYHGP